jgi:formyltetrahydrofolate-dependent phosphoribosylglycinamide formyltransferase
LTSDGRRARLVVLISGSGSNLQALLDAAAAATLPAEVVGVVSNRKDAYGLVRAREAGVPTVYFPYKPYRESGRSRQTYDADLAAEVAAFRPDFVVLAGWMHILSAAFLDRFPNRVLNLHPALPGTFVGTHAIERAYDAYRRGEITHSGCMVHLAIPEVDAGPVVGSAVVPFYPTDSLETFETRMHTAEHALLVEAVATVIAQLAHHAVDVGAGAGHNRSRQSAG